MKNPFFRFLFWYMLLMNYVLFNVAANPETDIPLRMHETDPNYLSAVFKRHPDHCTIPCETKSCPHPKKLTAYYGPVQQQVAWLRATGLSYEVTNLLVQVMGLSLLWCALAYYLIGGFLATYRNVHWSLQIGFWLAFNLLLFFSLCWIVLYPAKDLFFDFVVVCLRFSWAWHLSLIDVYVVLFVFLLPTITLGLAIGASAKFVYGFLARRVHDTSPGI